MQNIAFAFPSYYRPIAVVTLLALLAWATGLPSLLSIAQAANVTQFSNTLSDSNPGSPALHTIQFTSVNPWEAGEIFRIYFTDEDATTTAFDLSLITAAQVTANTGMTVVATCDAGTDEVTVTLGVNYIEGTVCVGDTVPAGTIELVVGNPGNSAQQIVNPTTVGSYIIRLSGEGATPIPDNGDTRVAIIDNVTVTATVETIFTFAILGVNEGESVNGDVTVTSGTSTATSVPFGVIAPDIPKLMAQELRVNTNAINGFAVTVFANQSLTSANGATIDQFANGLGTDVPLSWTGNQPDGDILFPDTWGHWGLTTDDTTLSSTTAPIDYFSGGADDANYIGDFIGIPVEVFYHDGPVLSDSGQGVGSTTVAYKVQITTLQEAATDYTAILTYIATPVF